MGGEAALMCRRVECGVCLVAAGHAAAGCGQASPLRVGGRACAVALLAHERRAVLGLPATCVAPTRMRQQRCIAHRRLRRLLSGSLRRPPGYTTLGGSDMCTRQRCTISRHCQRGGCVGLSRAVTVERRLWAGCDSAAHAASQCRAVKRRVACSARATITCAPVTEHGTVTCTVATLRGRCGRAALSFRTLTRRRKQHITLGGPTPQ